MSAPARAQFDDLGLSSNCVDVLRHLWEYLDDELTPAGAERLRLHLESCPQCKAMEGYQACFLDTMRRLRAQFTAPSELRARLAEKLRSQGCGCWDKVSREKR
jgi:anti-sigma factor (TIGR02949 family)